jgi:transcriptional regulator with XRE-family HTH domain
MNTGERIKKLRKSKGWNQSELGKKVGLTYGGISGIEENKSNPKLNVLIKISELFNVSTDYLLTGKEESRLLNEQESEILNLYRRDPDVQKELNSVLEEKKNMMSRLRRFFVERRFINLPIKHERRAA